MNRILSFIVATALSSTALAGDLPVLRADVIVSSATVQLGDLVENAGALSGTAVFRAPDLGQTGKVQAARIVEAAVKLGLSGLTANGLTEVKVTRLARVLAPAEIEAALRAALLGQLGLADPASLALTFDEPLASVSVEQTAMAPLAPARLDYLPQTGRFVATLAVADAASMKPLRVSGTAIEALETAVLTRGLARGEAVNPGDIAVQRLPRQQLGGQAPMSIADAAGRVAKRTLRPGEPLRVADLERPMLVGRNEMVTMVHRRPGLTLTVRGRAMQAGAHGDVVSVLNPQSKRTVQATVTASGTVEVAGPAPAVVRTASR